jgi:DNA-directed RNA polymerase subunit L
MWNPPVYTETWLRKNPDSILIELEEEDCGIMGRLRLVELTDAEEDMNCDRFAHYIQHPLTHVVDILLNNQVKGYALTEHFDWIGDNIHGPWSMDVPMQSGFWGDYVTVNFTFHDPKDAMLFKLSLR